MEIRKMTATTTTTTGAFDDLSHHHHHQQQHQQQIQVKRPQAELLAARLESVGISANQARSTTKHERISLKKLHSLGNQLLCGFKSFTSSTTTNNNNNEQPHISQTTVRPVIVKQEPIKVTKISRLNSELQLQISKHTKQRSRGNSKDAVHSKDCASLMMIVDGKNPTSCSGAGGKSSRDSKSSSWASLTITTRQQKQQQSSLQEDPSCHLVNLLASSQHHNPTAANEEQPLSRAAAADGCSFKRASFRRLTGRGGTTVSRKQQQLTGNEDQQEKMIRLIKQLDQLSSKSKQLGCSENDHETLNQQRDINSEEEPEEDEETNGVFELEDNWTKFVSPDRDEFKSNHHPTNSVDNKEATKCNLKIQQDAIWELLTSEVFYLKRIRVILRVFLETLFKLQQNSLLLEIDPVRLTSNIEEVYLANYTLWTKCLLPMLIQSRLSGCPLNPSAMKDAFIKISGMFDSYYRYCLEHTACLDYLRDRNKCDQYFKVYLAWCESQKDCERLRLMDLLAKPMQRLTKYPLLLKAIYRRTDDPKQLEDLRETIIGMEKFVLAVDLRLRDRDEIDQLQLVATRIESLDISSNSDYYCDEINKIIAQYCREYFHQLCKPLFDCPFGCNRRLIFDSSSASSLQHNLGQIKFKDHQMSSKLDIVLVLFTDQLLICKQVTNRWYSANSTQNAYERSSTINNLKSSFYNKSFNSSPSKHRSSSTKSNSQTNWITKSRSGSGNHLVDSLILANDALDKQQQQQHRKFARLLSAHNCGGSDQKPVSFHLSTSSLAGNAAREHFVISKSAECSRSGDHLAQSPSGSGGGGGGKSSQVAAQPQSSRLRAIRSPYPIDRLVMHELNDGHRIFCCQLNDSNTIATSFMLHIGSAATTTTTTETPKSPFKGEQHQANCNSATTIDQSQRSDLELGGMHHLSPLAGFSKRSGKLPGPPTQGNQQMQLSPARKLINLIEQAKLRYKAAASFHGIPLAPINIHTSRRNNHDLATHPFIDTLNVRNSVRREKSDASSTTKSISSISRSSELLELGSLNLNERPQTFVTKDETLAANFCQSQESDDSKVILEQEQLMLLKHGRYEELQAYKLDCTFGTRRNRSLFCCSNNLEASPTTNNSTFVSPLLSVSIDGDQSMRQPQVPSASIQNNVFEGDCNSLISGDLQQANSAPSVAAAAAECQSDAATQLPTGETIKLNNLNIRSNNQSSSTIGSEQTFDTRRGQSWSCSSSSGGGGGGGGGNRRALASHSGSDIDSTASDISPLAASRCPNLGHIPTSRTNSQQRLIHNNRRQVNHLRRQNDIVSSSHDQQELNCVLSGNLAVQSPGGGPGKACHGDPMSSSSLDETSTTTNLRLSTNNTDYSQPSLDSSAQMSSIEGSSQHRKYLSLARRIMQDTQNSSAASQATTMDQASFTLNDNQIYSESIDCEEGAKLIGQPRAVSIELGNLRAKLSSCLNIGNQESFPCQQQKQPNQSDCVNRRNRRPSSEDQISDHRVLHSLYHHHHHHQDQGNKPQQCHLSKKSENENLEFTDESQIYLEIPSRSHQLLGQENLDKTNDCSSGGTTTRQSSYGTQQGFISGDEVAQDPIEGGRKLTDQVSVPVLNVTSCADSHCLSKLEDYNYELEIVDASSSRGFLTKQSRLIERFVPVGSETHNRNDEEIESIEGEPLRLEPFKCGHEQISTNSLDVNRCSMKANEDLEMYDCVRQSILRTRENGSFDEERASLNYRGHLLELKCIHKLIHQDEGASQNNGAGRGGQCGGRVYLGFYEKLNLHLKQTADIVDCQRQKMQVHTSIASKQQSEGELKKTKPKKLDHPGRLSPARSDSGASKRMRSIRMFTNDLIGSLVRATSSCSVHSKD